MNPGGKAALLISCMALVGCARTTDGLKIKALGDSAEALSRGGDEIDLARAQLALGNVGLALEAFRKAQRDNPSDTAPLAGIGDCYASMARFDIAQLNYEAALALRPHDRSLLLGLASIFEQEGKPALALAARAEANFLTQPGTPTLKLAEPVPTLASAASAPSTHGPVASIGSITVDLPPARPVAHTERRAIVSRPLIAQQETHAAPLPPPQIGAPVALSPTITVSLPRLRVTRSAVSATPLESGLASAQDPTPVIVHAAVAPPMRRTPSSTRSAGIVAEVALAPTNQLRLRTIPRASLLVQDLLAETGKPVVAEPAPTGPTPEQAPDPALIGQAVLGQAPGPRLERLSLGEVALITSGKPIWRAPDNMQTASAGPRWVALDRVSRPNIQVLNAARNRGLAASARTILSARGWRRIAIGDAPAAQLKSVVLYPKGQASLGRRLAAQFGVSARLVQRINVILILGRDVAGRIGGQRTS
jgi:hypothetical protein